MLSYDRAFLDLLEGRLRDAEAGFLKARNAFSNVTGGTNQLAATLSSLSQVCIRRRRYAEAEAYAREAISILTNAFGPNHPETARNLNDLAVVYLSTGRAREAEPLIQSGILLAEASLSPSDPALRNLLLTYVTVLKRIGRKSEARNMEIRAARISETPEAQDPGRLLVDVEALKWRK
jgi:tetratricopeptide (TPR) repeat protein